MLIATVVSMPAFKMVSFSVLLLATCFTDVTSAQSVKTKAAARPARRAAAAPGATPTPTPTSTPNGREILKVTIYSSRSTVTRDASYGIFADLFNVTSDIVTLRPEETKLVVHPEVAQPNACYDEQNAIFPAHPLQSAAPGTARASDQASSEIQLYPQEHYTVFWDLTPDASPRGKCAAAHNIANYLGFVPGDYTFTVEGLVHTPETKAHPAGVHTYTQTTTLKVGLSQLSTSLAAFLGALFAYSVVAFQRGRDFDRWKGDLPGGHKARIVLAILRNAVGAGLLGAAVTIVASRLSETQFPIKVSVNDFWGALTIGFVAFFLGTRFILAIASKLPPPQGSPQKNEPGSKPPAGGETPAKPASSPAAAAGA